ncbi:TPA: hypothetical protein ACPYPK_003116 [Legionella pneumophila]
MPNLSDYKVLNFFMSHVELEIDLTKTPVQVKSKLTITPNPKANEPSTELVLDGQNMQLTSVSINGKTLPITEYTLNEHALILKNVPQSTQFSVETTTLLRENTDLFGLYETEGTVLVKAETEGLRRVFFCIDRPDNLATYRTTVIANHHTHPVLLSNGDLIKREELEDGIQCVTWFDKVPKPSYLHLSNLRKN